MLEPLFLVVAPVENVLLAIDKKVRKLHPEVGVIFTHNTPVKSGEWKLKVRGNYVCILDFLQRIQQKLQYTR
jgi:hypothetical protein